MIFVPIGASVQIFAVIVEFVEKSNGVSTIVNTPAHAAPVFLTIFNNFVLVLPVDCGAATASTVAEPPSKPVKSDVIGLVSKSNGKSTERGGV